MTRVLVVSVLVVGVGLAGCATDDERFGPGDGSAALDASAPSDARATDASDGARDVSLDEPAPWEGGPRFDAQDEPYVEPEYPKWAGDGDCAEPADAEGLAFSSCCDGRACRGGCGLFAPDATPLCLCMGVEGGCEAGTVCCVEWSLRGCRPAEDCVRPPPF